MSATKRPTLRDITDQFRIDRHRALLDTGLRIVTDEGLAALTIARLANDLECSVGTVYRHFATKELLLAELEREAVDLIATSFRLSLTHAGELLATRPAVDPRVDALARVVTAIRFWIQADEVVPREAHLMRRALTDPGTWIAADGAGRVIPVAERLLESAIELLDAATATGALRSGRSLPRAITIVTGTTGVLMSAGLGPWEEDDVDPHALAIDMARDLLLSWGADPASLGEAGALVDELAAAGHLVPSVRAGR
jgi:AcrR family transcriptional regulator